MKHQIQSTEKVYHTRNCKLPWIFTWKSLQLENAKGFRVAIQSIGNNNDLHGILTDKNPVAQIGLGTEVDENDSKAEQSRQLDTLDDHLRGSPCPPGQNIALKKVANPMQIHRPRTE